jgi:hypothetical protein
MVARWQIAASPEVAQNHLYQRNRMQAMSDARLIATVDELLAAPDGSAELMQRQLGVWILAGRDGLEPTGTGEAKIRQAALRRWLDRLRRDPVARGLVAGLPRGHALREEFLLKLIADRPDDTLLIYWLLQEFDSEPNLQTDWDTWLRSEPKRRLRDRLADRVDERPELRQLYEEAIESLDRPEP